MLKLSLISKYIALILLAFFLTSCQEEEIENTNNIPYKEQIKNFEAKVKAANKEDRSKEIKPESSDKSLIHWSTLLVIFLVLTSLIFVVIYSLYDVKQIKGFSFQVSRKKSEKPKPKHSEKESNPAMKEKNPEIQIPSSDMEAHIAQQSQNINELKKDLANLLKNIDDMNQTFLTLKDNLDRKDEELARFKDGYDATIFKNFILRFTRVDKVLKESISDQNYTQGALEDIQIQMEDALAECDIKIFSPSVGDDFKSLEGVADNPKQIETSKKNQNLTIADVIQPGYRRKLPGSGKDNFQIITEAKVAIYIYKDN